MFDMPDESMKSSYTGKSISGKRESNVLASYLNMDKKTPEPLKK